MSWFRRKPEPPKTEVEGIRLSLATKGVPDPIAEMFLEEYLHARHPKKKDSPLREIPDFNQPVERVDMATFLSYLVGKAE